jgi:sugar phosphate isomerase/epimerase
MIRCYLAGASLGWALLVGVPGAGAGEPAVAGKGLTNAFFPYCASASDGVLRELGYTPLRNLYVSINLDKTPPYAPGLTDQVRKLKGTDTIFWLCVLGWKDKDKDDQAVAVIRELAAVAEQSGVRVAIYPHRRLYVATAREALRLVKKVDRKNVGLTITLCHELAGDKGPDLPQIVDEVRPYLFVVTINGADRKEKGQNLGWDRLIQPLGQGNFDVYAFLKKLKAVGYTGPIGLQCYGLKGDPLVYLRQSSRAWKEYSARLAAEETKP